MENQDTNRFLKQGRGNSFKDKLIKYFIITKRDSLNNIQNTIPIKEGVLQKTLNTLLDEEILINGGGIYEINTNNILVQKIIKNYYLNSLKKEYKKFEGGTISSNKLMSYAENLLEKFNILKPDNTLKEEFWDNLEDSLHEQYALIKKVFEEKVEEEEHTYRENLKKRPV